MKVRLDDISAKDKDINEDEDECVNNDQNTSAETTVSIDIRKSVKYMCNVDDTCVNKYMHMHDDTVENVTESYEVNDCLNYRDNKDLNVNNIVIGSLCHMLMW